MRCRIVQLSTRKIQYPFNLIQRFYLFYTLLSPFSTAYIGRGFSLRVDVTLFYYEYCYRAVPMGISNNRQELNQKPHIAPESSKPPIPVTFCYILTHRSYESQISPTPENGRLCYTQRTHAAHCARTPSVVYPPRGGIL